ncbi:MAG: hypothetical protein ACM3X4_00325 [Ignavibacteriales bacterium]
MTTDVIHAIEIVQKKSLASCSNGFLERCDLALDSLVRNPDRTGDPRHLARNALADARKKLRVREQKCGLGLLEDVTTLVLKNPKYSVSDEIPLAEIHVADFLERSGLDPKDKSILAMLYQGASSDSIASRYEVSVQNARVWISRARKRARIEWQRQCSDELH